MVTAGGGDARLTQKNHSRPQPRRISRSCWYSAPCRKLRLPAVTRSPSLTSVPTPAAWWCSSATRRVICAWLRGRARRSGWCTMSTRAGSSPNRRCRAPWRPCGIFRRSPRVPEPSGSRPLRPRRCATPVTRRSSANGSTVSSASRSTSSEGRRKPATASRAPCGGSPLQAGCCSTWAAAVCRSPVSRDGRCSVP